MAYYIEANANNILKIYPYLLDLNIRETHATFRYGFEEDFDYDDLKKTVILVLKEKIKAVSSSRKTKN
ncbi:hypothetical protein [Winogradskyella sediminis]|uniref:Uncharacterized protein n=1 Tax=Winogradskyella sediminis TaxID=1382466 RepID=A0A1H1LYD5_9FLAO|nr:hypothetical protein [Winogradskyella sediminis]SDR79614.1 hypothetical protein SAMN04489797_0145 [Winogradskyella sediminis]